MTSAISFVLIICGWAREEPACWIVTTAEAPLAGVRRRLSYNPQARAVLWAKNDPPSLTIPSIRYHKFSTPHFCDIALPSAPASWPALVLHLLQDYVKAQKICGKRPSFAIPIRNPN